MSFIFYNQRTCDLFHYQPTNFDGSLSIIARRGATDQLEVLWAVTKCLLFFPPVSVKNKRTHVCVRITLRVRRQTYAYDIERVGLFCALGCDDIVSACLLWCASFICWINNICARCEGAIVWRDLRALQCGHCTIVQLPLRVCWMTRQLNNELISYNNS